MTIKSPVIYETEYSREGIKNLVTESENDKKVIFEYPTVYIVNDTKKDEYTVYVGETTNIGRRTEEHLLADSLLRDDWKELADSDSSKMFVIGHNHFNKSLTLDIENRLMQYMTSVDKVKKVNNRRTNQQNNYYTADQFDEIFSKIWRKLNKKNKDLFPTERIIKDSALFKASPFHKLTDEQLKAKDEIILKTTESLSQNKVGQLIVVEGEAGSGKTVLLSSLFYELNQLANDSSEDPENIVIRNLGKKQQLIVNHEQQLKVYQQIATKLGILNRRSGQIVSRPTTFINNTLPEDKVDIVIVDEAHLLWTQGKQSYRGSNQLKDLLDRAKVVIAVLDKNQILSREQYWDDEEFDFLIHEAILNNQYVYLDNQLRINGDDETIYWIRTLIDENKILNIPKDSKGYNLEIFDDIDLMYKKIKKKSENEDSGISRMLSTFDWDYVDKRKPDNGDEFWNVEVDGWKLPWNLQLPQNKEEKRKNKDLAWAEQRQTINEVGSTFTIQGFDLNYAGVIIGPSVKYRDGKIIYDPKGSKNKKATQRRTLKTGEKVEVSDKLLKNELNVLLTRGVNGLYIYAVDEELREALKLAKEGKLKL
ncbi:ATP-dependent exonuclease [Floricoccus penangensis]|uniref:ATP-dependent exonuclease n=1 Tax=Floricoccus penangensis TaxID=1859475 RepID=A0A9Q5JHN7_9LACT|nr:DUF2075 domain-containing protein [Floricoccus penangensis]OFI47719.1 ATP-dependent exonuclease [Floricoccus penangensis]